MENKVLLRFALLLLAGAFIMTASAKPKDSESMEEKSTESMEEADETTTMKPMKMKTSKKTDMKTDETTTMKSMMMMKTDTKEIEKLILGSFRMTSDPEAEDFNKLLKAMEFEKEDRKKVRKAKEIDLTLTKEDKMKYKMMVTAGSIMFETTFKIGKEFSTTLFDGRQFKGTVNYDGNNKLVKDEKHIGFTCHHVSEYTKKGFTIHLECNGVKATQEFKRMKMKPGKKGGVKIDVGK